MTEYVNWPEGAGHCFKQKTKATIVATDGTRYVGYNHILRPQGYCPRDRVGFGTGEGYWLCTDMCVQTAHAEINAIEHAGDAAQDGDLYLEGHYYVCDDCLRAAERAGIKNVIIGSPKEAA